MKSLKMSRMTGHLLRSRETMSLRQHFYHSTPWLVVLLLHCNASVSFEHFSTEFWGSLSNHLDVLFSGEGSSLISAAINCKTKCSDDRRCIGLEICKIQKDLYRCRACCAWKKLGRERSYGDLNNCKYFRMTNSVILDNSNLIMPSSVSLSSVFSNGYPPHLPSYAVDNITDCDYTNVAASQREENPWLRVDLGAVLDVQQVLVYARPDGFEPGRTHNLLITVADNEKNHTCGFYPGPTDLGDRILILCNFLTRGRYVTLTIQSSPGEKDILQVCEIKVHRRQ